MFYRIICVFVCYWILVLSTNINSLRKFPNEFLFGASSASYQIEGAWNISEKGESIWDRLTHTRPELIKNKDNGDVASDSYNNYKKDVEILSYLGAHVYRFSLSWSRLCPNGICLKFNKAGLDFYNNLIDELIKNGIRPAITLYHWDLPQRLQDLGGWTNPVIADYFEWYAEKCFQSFGDRVKLWLTFNEPRDVCLLGYAKNNNAPALEFDGIANYLCVDTYLKAHARVYRLYDTVFRKEQHGKIGLTFSTHWYHPADNSTESLQAADTIRQFEAGLYAHPIFGKEGDYPKNVRDIIDRKSEKQGFPKSRLPKLDDDSIKFVKGTSDFFGINHYTTKLAKPALTDEIFPIPSYEDDHRVEYYQKTTWQGASAGWLKVVPWGFRNLLNWVKNTYDNPEVIVFENGYADYGELNDTVRVEYLKAYLNALLDAIDDGCNVTGYMVWTLIDNFEWRAGYVERFGLYHVDFNDPQRPRTPKLSAEYYKSVIKNHGV